MEDWLTYAGLRAAVKGSVAMIAVLASLALLSTQPTQAASFDCEEAGTAVEKMICADMELSRLDEELAGAYADALALAADPRSLTTQQRAWLRDSRDTCINTLCLKAAYEARIAELKEMAATAGTGGKQAPPVIHRDFEISRGAESELCIGLERGFREHGLIPLYGKICGVPFPEGVETFEQIHWQDMDPSENLTLLKQILYWSNLDTRNFGTEFKRQLNSPKIIPELFDRIIGPAETQIAELLAAGAIKLQVSRFDVDNDEAVETVYRMSAIRLRRRYHPVWIPENSCKVTVKGWEDRPLNYLVVKAGVQHPLEGRGHAASHLYYFRHQGVTYSSASDFTISKLKPIKDMPRFATVVCGFRTLEGE